MTLHTVRVSCSQDQTATAKLFAASGMSDDVLYTADTVAEQTNDKGSYLCSFDDVDAGDYKIKLFSTASGRALSEGYCTLAGTDGEVAEAYPTPITGVALSAAYDAAKTAATQASLDSMQTDVDGILGYVTSLVADLTALAARFTGMTSLADWLRRAFRKDEGTAGMETAEDEIKTGGTATYVGLTDNLESIKDNATGTDGYGMEVF